MIDVIMVYMQMYILGKRSALVILLLLLARSLSIYIYTLSSR